MTNSRTPERMPKRDALKIARNFIRDVTCERFHSLFFFCLYWNVLLIFLLMRGEKHFYTNDTLFAPTHVLFLIKK